VVSSCQFLALAQALDAFFVFRLLRGDEFLALRGAITQDGDCSGKLANLVGAPALRKMNPIISVCQSADCSRERAERQNDGAHDEVACCCKSKHHDDQVGIGHHVHIGGRVVVADDFGCESLAFLFQFRALQVDRNLHRFRQVIGSFVKHAQVMDGAKAQSCDNDEHDCQDGNHLGFQTLQECHGLPALFSGCPTHRLVLGRRFSCYGNRMINSGE
jgi:hypothetical protein